MRMLAGICLLAAAAVTGRSFEWAMVSAPAGEVRDQSVTTASAVEAVEVTALKIAEPAVAVDAAPSQGPYDRLRRSLQRASEIPMYSAHLEQQVRLKDRLLDPEVMEVKLRREPFSVFIRWPHDNQQALYVDGEHKSQLLVRPTRGLFALRGTWTLRPDSSQAMQRSRYPVTTLGIEKLCSTILEFHDTTKDACEGMTWKETPVTFEGRSANLVEFTFASEQVSPMYSIGKMWFDSETELLVAVEHYTWGDGEEKTPLLERYVYRNFQPGALGPDDFSRANPNYNFN